MKNILEDKKSELDLKKAAVITLCFISKKTNDRQDLKTIFATLVFKLRAIHVFL